MTLHRPRRVLATKADRQMWSYLVHGELRLQRCAKCRAYRFPPAGVCEACLSEDWTWEATAGEGTVLSWVTYHRAYFPMIECPYTVVVAQTPEGVPLTADYVGDAGALATGDHVVLQYDDATFDDDGGSSKLYRWSSV